MSWYRSALTRESAFLSGARLREAFCPENIAGVSKRRKEPGTKWGEPPIHDENKLYDIIEAVVAIAEGRKVSPAQIAIAYLLGRPAVTSVIIGARTEEQLIDNLAAANVALTAEERARLDAVSQPILLYPYWHQAKTAKERLSEADLSLLAPHIDK
jgi:aryl-alcohol dehydrogenase-like predicted oxidoreductase